MSPLQTLALLICALYSSTARALLRSPEWMNGKVPVPSQIENFVPSPAAMALNLHTDGFCNAAGIHCTDADRSRCINKPYRRLLDAQLDGSTVCALDPDAQEAARHSRRFFRLAELSPATGGGAAFVKFPLMYDAAGTKFLAHHLSTQLPFDLDHVPEILETLHIAGAPVTKIFMVATLEACGHAPSAIEVKTCARSLKEMSGFVSSALGSDSPAVYASKGVEKLYGKMVEVREITQLVPRTEIHVACHRMAYPYLVHYCHRVEGTEVFSARIDHRGSSFTVLLECHTITSYMERTNSILTQLNLRPGEGEYCHFIESTAMIFARK